MALPKRIEQHKAESESYAILLYKLRKVGIFRNVTENDYGIDFEIELVDGESVTGKYVKAQVKSSKKIRIRKADRVPVISGIKQSTLLYWAELSYKTNVLVYAVDLNNENIYITKPIFWQATKLLDKTNTKKTIEFLAINEKSGEAVSVLTQWYSIIPSVNDIIHFHQSVLRHMKDYVEMYRDIFGCDFHMPMHRPELLRPFFEACKYLCYNKKMSSSKLTSEENENLLNYIYWARQGTLLYDEIPNYILYKPMPILMGRLLEAVYDINCLILNAKYYWLNHNINYLRLVYESYIPEMPLSHDELLRWCGDYEENANHRKAKKFYEFASE